MGKKSLDGSKRRNKGISGGGGADPQQQQENRSSLSSAGGAAGDDAPSDAHDAGTESRPLPSKKSTAARDGKLGRSSAAGGRGEGGPRREDRGSGNQLESESYRHEDDGAHVAALRMEEEAGGGPSGRSGADSNVATTATPPRFYSKHSSGATSRFAAATVAEGEEPVHSQGSLPPPPLAMPSLEAQANLMEPGAYRYRPGADVRRAGADFSGEFDDGDHLENDERARSGQNGGSAALNSASALAPNASASIMENSEDSPAREDPGIPMAVPVDDDDEENEINRIDLSRIVQARPVTARNERNKRCIMATAVAVAAIAVILAVSLASTLGRRRPVASPSAPTRAPTASPTTVPPNASVVLQEFTLDLPNATRIAIEDDPISPQALSYGWLASASTGEDGMLPPIFESSAPDDPARRMRQLFALGTLYYATSGDAAWTNRGGWLDLEVESECTAWFGCACYSQQWVSALDLRGNNLEGSLPPEFFGILSYLEYLRLDNNNLLGGSIPSEVGSLPRLVGVSAPNCALTGTLPTELGNVTSLTSIDVSANILVGQIPSEMGSLTDLIYLNLYSNQLSGSLPTTLGNLVKAQVFSFFDNSLGGSIPSQFGGLLSLVRLDLSSCGSLSGSIPTELGMLTKLEMLLVNSNVLTGRIPTHLAALTKLQLLRLNNNLLVGTVPSELGWLTGLRELSLEGNSLTGTVPDELCALVSGGALKLTVDCDASATLTCTCNCLCP